AGPESRTRAYRTSITSRQAAEKGPAARRRPTAAREAYSLYVERAAEGAVPPQMGPSRQLPDRPPRRVQLRGGAPRAVREAYSLYVERADEGANEADGPFSAACYGQLVPLIRISPSGTALYP